MANKKLPPMQADKNITRVSLNSPTRNSPSDITRKLSKKKNKSDLSIFEGGLSQHLSFNQNSIAPPKPIKVSYPIEGEEDGIIFLENLLSLEECKNLIQATEKIGYISVAGFDKEVRSNSRCRTLDSGMSSAMLTRIYDHVPQTLIIDGLRWNLSGFLDNWRYCKYNKGEHFSPHYDGSKKFSTYEMSVFTVNIYLNEGFAGGGTRFYMDCVENAPENNFDVAGPVTHVVQPKQGSALIFNHCNKGYLHDGEQFVPTDAAQAKYIMRADLVYAIDVNDLDHLKEKEARGMCKFWSIQAAEDEIVVNYVGRTWQCACVSHNVTVTLL